MMAAKGLVLGWCICEYGRPQASWGFISQCEQQSRVQSLGLAGCWAPGISDIRRGFREPSHVGGWGSVDQRIFCGPFQNTYGQSEEGILAWLFWNNSLTITMHLPQRPLVYKCFILPLSPQLILAKGKVGVSTLVSQRRNPKHREVK